ncbi:GRIP1-associated protein 1 [Eudromia elegans]
MAQALSEDEFQRMQGQLLELRSENYRLEDELRRSSAELAGLRQRVQGLDQDLAKAHKALSKSKKAQEVQALLGETRLLQGKLQSQEDEFRLQNRTLLRELEQLCAQIEGLERENRSLRGAGGGTAPPPAELVAKLQEEVAKELSALRRRLAETEGAAERGRRQAQELLERRQREHEEAAGALRERLQAEAERRAEAERLRELQEAEGRALRQELKDVRDGQRILERKGSAALKDLKRQLQLERRRSDRLQERIQELLAPGRPRPGLEEAEGADSSSLSSYGGREGSAPGSSKSGSGSPGGGSPGGGAPGAGAGSGELSAAEAAELLERLARSQQERWLLEEKVRHLEASGASMAEDLCHKSAIIEGFIRDSRLDAVAAAPPPPRRGRGPPPGEGPPRDMNKRLQNLLEEQLTKNLHLARDLESLSQELEQLRKERGAPP